MVFHQIRNICFYQQRHDLVVVHHEIYYIRTKIKDEMMNLMRDRSLLLVEHIELTMFSDWLMANDNHPMLVEHSVLHPMYKTK
jgi:hypothetical protein